MQQLRESIGRDRLTEFGRMTGHGGACVGAGWLELTKQQNMDAEIEVAERLEAPKGGAPGRNSATEL